MTTRTFSDDVLAALAEGFSDDDYADDAIISLSPPARLAALWEDMRSALDQSTKADSRVLSAGTRIALFLEPLNMNKDTRQLYLALRGDLRKALDKELYELRKSSPGYTHSAAQEDRRVIMDKVDKELHKRKKERLAGKRVCGYDRVLLLPLPMPPSSRSRRRRGWQCERACGCTRAEEAALKCRCECAKQPRWRGGCCACTTTDGCERHCVTSFGGGQRSSS